jgi:hypothetical protein
LTTGFCYWHTPGLPKGPQTPEARAAASERSRQILKTLWATRWKDGRPLTEESRARISEAQKRRPHPKGQRHTEEARRKMSEAAKARSPESRKLSEETKRKMSESAKRRLASPEARAKVSEQLRKRHAARREEAERSRPPKMRFVSEEGRRKISEAAKARLSDPQYRARQMENLRRGQAAKREAAQREGAA